MRIAMIGQRGVPATFGGVERHVEEVGARLAVRGHDVTVYCRSNYTEEPTAIYRGMTLRHVRAPQSKHFEAIAHSAVSTADALRQRPDIVHYHALGPGLVAPLPRYLSRSRVVLTVHGLDNERAKWGLAGRAVLGMAHRMSAVVPDATIVVSADLAHHYEAEFDRRTTYIPNGVEPPAPCGHDLIAERFGLAPGSYVLFVGRLVPEKAPHLLLEAFRALDTNLRLVIAGGSSYTDGYVERLHGLADRDPRVLMTGYVYGDALVQLYTHAAAFVLPSTLEGLPLTLLEAAAHGIPVVASDIPPHREIIAADQPGARLFPSENVVALTAALRTAVTAPDERRGARRLRTRVLTHYRWDAAAAATEQVYASLLTASPRVRPTVSIPAQSIPIQTLEVGPR